MDNSPAAVRITLCIGSPLTARLTSHIEVMLASVRFGAAGSTIAGGLVARCRHPLGFVAAGFIVLALVLVMLIRPRPAAAATT